MSTASPQAPGRRALVLVAGFGPLPSAPVAPGAMVVRTLRAEADAATPAAPQVTAIEAPNAWAAGRRSVLEALAATRADAVLLIDRAAPEDPVRVAEAAANAASTLKDSQGLQWPGPRLAPGGPRLLRARVPAQRIAAAVAKAGAPVSTAATGGDDPANACFYALLARGGSPPAVLLRAPTPLETLRREGVAGPAALNAAQLMAAVMAAIHELAAWVAEERAREPR